MRTEQADYLKVLSTFFTYAIHMDFQGLKFLCTIVQLHTYSNELSRVLYNQIKISYHTISLLVVDRVYPNPKTRRVLGNFCKPERTRTRGFLNLQYPNP